MAATKRNVNIRNVTFTPTGGSATTITGVTALSVAVNGSILKFSGDADRYTTTAVNDFNDPGITVTTADIAALTANGTGTFGAFSATIKDAKQQTASAGAGDITVVLNQCIVADTPFSQSYRQFGQGTLSLTSISSDGLTSPLSLSIL